MIRALAGLLFVGVMLAQSPTPVFVAASKTEVPAGGTEIRVAMRWESEAHSGYLVQITVDGAGCVESFTRLVPKQEVPGFPSRFVGTYANFYSPATPDSVTILRLKVTPVKSFDEAATSAGER